MDNQKDSLSSKQIKNIQYGLLAQVYDLKASAQTQPLIKQAVLVSELNENTTSLAPRTTKTKWVYEGVITIPQDGQYLFMVDQHNSSLSIDINHQKIELHQQQTANGITFEHLQAGQQFSIIFTTTTDGTVPRFRFYWDAGNGFEMVPDKVIQIATPEISVPQPEVRSEIQSNLQNIAIQQIITDEVMQHNLQLGYYKGRGRIAVLRDDSTLFNALTKQSPTESLEGKTAFQLISWLADKSRSAGENHKTYILSAVDEKDFSGFQIHPKHNLFIDSFNSPHKWLQGDTRAADQLADALLPSGQWHRHYDITLLPSDANDQQVSLVRHWMELTGGSVLIQHNSNNLPSAAIQQLISEIQSSPNQQQITVPMATRNKDGLHLTVNHLDPYTNEATFIFENIIPAHLLQNQQTPLTPRKAPTQWIYNGTISASQDGNAVLMLEKRGMKFAISYTVNGQTITVDKNQPLGHLSLNNLKAGQAYPLQITVTNNGEVPQFRLVWDINSNTQRVPNQSLHHGLADFQPEQIDVPNITTSSCMDHSYQQVITLPSTAINSLNLTEEMVSQAEYFSLFLKTKESTKPIIFEDIRLSPHTSWQSLTQEIEKKINQHLEAKFNIRLTVKFQNNNIIIQSDGCELTQFQLKKNQPINYISIKPEYGSTAHFKSRKEHGNTIHTINLHPSDMNELTHLSLVLTEGTGEPVQLIKTQFRSLHKRVCSPEQFVENLQNYLQLQTQTSSLVVHYDQNRRQLQITDPLNRTLRDLNFGLQHQTLPFVITQNEGKNSDTLTVGAITDKLPTDENIFEYHLLEAPKFGTVMLDPQTGEWHYQANSNNTFNGTDQFHVIAIMQNEQKSAPMSIQIQSDSAPIVSYPGKRVFTISDPIYHEPAKRHYSVPDDMQVKAIQLAQTHLQEPNAPYFLLTANRWALLKVDITSQSSADAPDITAIITNKQGDEVARIRLMGPKKLPQQLPSIPNVPSVASSELHNHSYTAPLKGQWVQPSMQIQLMAGDTPIVMPYTDHNGLFTPKVSESNEMTSRITNHSLYRTGHGVYTYSPLSWGMEAAAKLPTTAFTLYNYPTIAQSLPLDPAVVHRSALFMPIYDRKHGLYDNNSEQISWGFHRGVHTVNVNGLDSGFNYYALTPNGTVDLLGRAWKNQGGGIARPDVMWHELYGHGFGLEHTTENNAKYPFDAKKNGFHIGYDQQTQSYITYRYTDPENKVGKEVIPALYPHLNNPGHDPFNAFTPHSDYFTQRAQQFLREKLRWQPNKIVGQDSEDKGFAGEGYYQCWSEATRQWVTLNENNFSQFYPNDTYHSLAHQRDVPVYWIQALIVAAPNNQIHPYSSMKPLRTIGNLPAEYHNLTTGAGRPYSHHIPYALTVTYATKQGLLTESLQAISFLEIINLNIPDKGELVKIEIAKIDDNKQLGQVIYTYKNPSSLANRLFNQWSADPHLVQLTLDNYWRDGQLFWSATDPDLINIQTGKINRHKLNKNSAICATWIENGQRHQQYFSLTDPWGEVTQTLTEQLFLPINHLSEWQTHHNIVPTISTIESAVPLLADVHINQLIDISALPPDNYCYWVTLLVEDQSGVQQEQTPLEAWQITRKGEQLSVVGTIDSTPELKISGIKIHIDKHLQDEAKPFTITLTQNHTSTIKENTAYLDYNRPVVFNHSALTPELVPTMPEMTPL